MTNRPSGPVVPARTEPYPVRLLTAWLTAWSIPAMAIICVKAIQKVRADNRAAAACERIADAMERAHPALLLAPDVEVKDIRRAHDFKKASRSAAIKTNAALMSEAAGLLGQACKQNPEVCR